MDFSLCERIIENISQVIVGKRSAIELLLADEINRTIPRTQSSLLESMEERQVTGDSRTHLLSRPFFVIATQNPIELEGTFPLPEAQLDRFLLKLRLGYPEKDEEISVLERFREKDPLKSLKDVASPEQITELQGARKRPESPLRYGNTSWIS